VGANDLIDLPHHAAVVTPLPAGGSTRGASYKDIFTVGLPAAMVALVIIIMFGSLVGAFW